MRRLSMVALWTFANLTIGCGHAPPPTGQMEGTAAAIRAAQEAGAARVPQAALHAQMAQDQMGQAHTLINEGKAERGSYVLMRAQADAELARAIARAASSRQAAQQAAERLQSLNQGNP